MSREVAWLPAAIAVAAFGQQPQATIRVEVTAEPAPVQGAEVTAPSPFADSDLFERGHLRIKG